jgi:hypothetical protein
MQTKLDLFRFHAPCYLLQTSLTASATNDVHLQNDAGR